MVVTFLISNHLGSRNILNIFVKIKAIQILFKLKHSNPTLTRLVKTVPVAGSIHLQPQSVVLFISCQTM
jgi:hypothetical protein